jgi:hypothetical protein
LGNGRSSRLSLCGIPRQIDSLDRQLDWLDLLATSKRKFKSFTMDATFMGNTSESTWKAALLSNFSEITTNPLILINLHFLFL